MGYKINELKIEIQPFPLPGPCGFEKHEHAQPASRARPMLLLVCSLQDGRAVVDGEKKKDQDSVTFRFFGGFQPPTTADCCSLRGCCLIIAALALLRG